MPHQRHSSSNRGKMSRSQFAVQSSLSWEPTFLPASVEKLPGANCHYCDVMPVPGEKRFPMCSGCRSVSFCSTECQKKAWKTHKSFCRHNRQDNANTLRLSKNFVATPGSMPSFGDRINLLHNFRNAHSWHIHKTISSAIRSSGGSKNFDYDNKYIKFSLKYRLDCGGNPGIAFSVEKVEWKEVADLAADKNAISAFEARRPKREADAEHLRKTEPTFHGLVNVAVCMENYGLWDSAQMHELPPNLEKMARLAIHDDWAEEFQESIATGLVWSRNIEVENVARLGRIMKVGELWEWKAMSAAELVAEGYPAEAVHGRYF